MWIYLNDRFVPREQALVSVFDHGFLYGDGIYETLRTYGGRFLQRDQHVARLYRSASLIDLRIPLPETAWAELLEEALARNDLAGSPGGTPRDAYLRITISRGEGEIGLDPGLCPRPTLVVLVKPLSPAPAHLYRDGVALLLSSVRRNSSSALPPRIKSLNCLNNILAKSDAARAGAFDAVMLNGDGHLTECTASNLFFLGQGRLCTPSLDCGILDGVTRGIVLQLAREQGLAVEEGTYEAAALLGADEAFLTNTSLELMPVSEVGGHKIGTGSPGPVTLELHERFRRALSRFLS